MDSFNLHEVDPEKAYKCFIENTNMLKSILYYTKESVINKELILDLIKDFCKKYENIKDFPLSICLKYIFDNIPGFETRLCYYKSFPPYKAFYNDRLIINNQYIIFECKFNIVKIFLEEFYIKQDSKELKIIPIIRNIKVTNWINSLMMLILYKYRLENKKQIQKLLNDIRKNSYIPKRLYF